MNANMDSEFDNIETLTKHDLKWLKMYRYACEYYGEHGNLLIPPSYSIQVNNEIINLGIWIKTQRRKQKNKPLSKEKIELLESIGMVWTVGVEEKNNNIWFEKFEYAKEYYEEYGNLLIPRSFVIQKNNENINLGCWLNTQRCLYKNGKLTKKKIDLLESIGIVWKIKDWDYMFQKATQYYEKHVDLLVPRLFSFEENNKIINLGAWISNQRQDYKFKKISQERIDLLESIGMVWVVKTNKDKTIVLNKKWEDMYELLLNYYKNHNNILIPYNYTYIDENNKKIKLGDWLNRQRRLKRQKPNKENNRKIELLDNLGMCWEYVDDCLKQSVNIGTIGYVDHDKTTLTKSIIKELSKNNH